MARIRTIKPEFWSSPDTAKLDDPWGRLLFIAMWNWADDNGRGTANPKELAGFAFPNDDSISSADIRRMLGEIRRAFGVILYEVAGRPYYAIPSWDLHQKIDKRSTGRHPAPEDGSRWEPDPDSATDLHERNGQAQPPTKSAEDPPSLRSDPGAGSWNRGTGEQGNKPPRGAAETVSPDRARDEPPQDEPPPPSLPEPPPGPAVMGPTAADAYRIVNRAVGLEHPHTVRTALAIEVGTLLKTGSSPDVISEALALWLEKPNLGPRVLPSLVSEVIRRRTASNVTELPKSKQCFDRGMQIAEERRAKRLDREAAGQQAAILALPGASEAS